MEVTCNDGYPFLTGRQVYLRPLAEDDRQSPYRFVKYELMVDGFR
jgi:hypothetical protein